MEHSVDAVTCVRTLVHSAQARVAEFEIQPGTEGEVHYHSQAAEYCVCLSGRLQVRLGGGQVHILEPGARLEIPPGETHQVINPGVDVSRYLVVQYGGVYDFVTG